MLLNVIKKGQFFTVAKEVSKVKKRLIVFDEKPWPFLCPYTRQKDFLLLIIKAAQFITDSVLFAFLLCLVPARKFW